MEVIAVARQVQTLLFTDIVGSTDRLQDLGDAAWAALLARHHGVVRGVLAAHGGREVNTAGDGFLARFDAPAPAVRAAAAAVAGVAALGMEIRVGLHTGEVELDGEEIGGVGVHLAARVMAQAGAGQVLVSSTVRELLAGSGLRFVEFGVRQLKGFAESWRLFALDLATVPSDEAERLAGGPRGLVAPAQLPHGLLDFTGRVAELDRLQALLDAAGRDRAAVVVSVVSGTAGVGKTALAVHWAHRVGRPVPRRAAVRQPARVRPERVGDGRRPRRSAGSWTPSACRPSGSRPTWTPRPPCTAACWPAGGCWSCWTTPATPSRSARCCPARPGCLVVVTSRNQLTGLVAAEGAHPLTLDLLTAAEARELLARRLGAEPGGRRARRGRRDHRLRAPGCRWRWPSWPPAPPPTPASRSAALAAELRDARGRLDAFAGGDPATDVRAVFSWSYQRAQPRRRPGCSGCSGCTPARTSRVPAAASLAGLPTDRGAAAAGRADPGAPGHRAHPRPVHLPRPAARLRHRTGPQPRHRRRAARRDRTGCSTTTCTPPTPPTGCSTRTGTRSP